RVGEMWAVGPLLGGAVPAGADRRMVEEDPPADVDEDRPLRVRLDVARLLLLADAEEVEKGGDVAAAEQDDAAARDRGDRQDRGDPAPRETGDDRRRDRGQGEADRPGARPRHDQPGDAADAAQGGEPP